MFPNKTMRTLLLGTLIVFIGCNRGGNDARHVEGSAPEDKPAASGVEWTVTSLSPEASAKYRNWQPRPRMAWRKDNRPAGVGFRCSTMRGTIVEKAFGRHPAPDEFHRLLASARLLRWQRSA